MNFKDIDIELINEATYSFESSDNKYQYPIVHVDDLDSQVDYGTKHGIRLLQNDQLINSAIVVALGGATDIHENSALLSSNELLLCCANWVFCLELPSLELKWKARADQATCFGIYHATDGYIIHGEMEISKLDRSGKIEWSEGGEDIFCTPDGLDDFRIDSGKVVVKDWNLKEYKFNIY